MSVRSNWRRDGGARRSAAVDLRQHRINVACRKPVPDSRPNGSHFPGRITRWSATLCFIERPTHPVGNSESLTLCKAPDLLEIPLVEQYLKPLTHGMSIS